MILNSNEVVELDIPSGESSGIKIKGEFLVAPGLSTKVVLDFDANESIHETGNGKFIMKPVIRIVNVSYDSTTGHHFEGASLKDFAVFSVDPSTQGIFLLPGGAQIEFQQGSVDDSKDFVVTMWEPDLLGALSNTYAFTPSYDFLVDPVFSLPVVAQKGAIRWDYDELPTTWGLNGNNAVMATATVPHFSCSGLGRFTGLPDGAWFSDPVIGLDLRGVLVESEFSDDYFDPTKGNAELPITRAEVIGMIVRSVFKQENPSNKSSFVDLAGSKFTKYIAYAESLQIIEGCDVPAKKFCPNKNINRAELAKVVAKTMWAAGRTSIADKVAYYKSHSANPLYNDVTVKEEWYYPYVYAVRDVGIMRGSKIGGVQKFRPADPINRIEAAKTICYLAYGDNCLGCKVTKYDAGFAAEYAHTNHELLYGPGGNQFLDFDPNGTATDGGNCTNFASQSLLGGLLRSASATYVYDHKDMYKDESGAEWHWYWNDYSTFIKVNELRGYAHEETAVGLHFDFVTTITPDDWGRYKDVQKGDIVFADWDADETFDHTMVVMKTINYGNPNNIRLAYQSSNRTNIGMKDIWSAGAEYKAAIFEVHRPVFFQK